MVTPQKAGCPAPGRRPSLPPAAFSVLSTPALGEDTPEQAAKAKLLGGCPSSLFPTYFLGLLLKSHRADIRDRTDRTSSLPHTPPPTPHPSCALQMTARIATTLRRGAGRSQPPVLEGSQQPVALLFKDGETEAPDLH